MQVKDIVFKDRIYYVYDDKDVKSEMLLVNPKNCKKQSSKLKIFDASKDNAREYLKFVDVVFGAEYFDSKNKSHQTNAGLDDATVKLIKKNDIIYGFDVIRLINQINHNNLDLILRIKQNFTLLSKYKVRILFFSGSSNVSQEQRNFISTYFRHI